MSKRRGVPLVLWLRSRCGCPRTGMERGDGYCIQPALLYVPPHIPNWCIHHVPAWVFGPMMSVGKTVLVYTTHRSRRLNPGKDPEPGNSQTTNALSQPQLRCFLLVFWNRHRPPRIYQPRNPAECQCRRPYGSATERYPCQLSGATSRLPARCPRCPRPFALSSWPRTNRLKALCTKVPLILIVLSLFLDLT